MWVIDTRGVARNLAMVHKIETFERHGRNVVYATFALKGEKNTNDPAFYETAILKIFDNSDDAKNYISELVEKLNRSENSLNIIAEVLNMRM